MKIRVASLLAIVGVLAVFLAAVPAAPAFSPAQGPARPEPAAPAFGAQLFLVTGAAGREPDLAESGITIHASLPAIPGSSGSRYLASGSAEASLQAGQAGMSVQVLDAATAGKVYYWLEVEGADGAHEAAARAGTIVFEDDRELLVALPAAEEIERLGELLAGGGRISRFDPIAMVLPGPGLRASPPAPAQAPADADPSIAALLPLITQAGLSGTLADLSGDRPAAIGARNVTIDTRNLLADHSADVEEYIYRSFTRLGLPASYVPWAYGSFSGRNVVAQIPGTTHPERIWLVGGHFDDRNADIYSTGYAPGADDNGTGIAATLAVASALAGHRFADTIRFVAFGAEEYGEWGSKAYAASLSASGAQMMGYIDLDMIGYDANLDRVVEIHSGTGPGSVSLGNAFVSANTRYGQGLSVELKTTTASNFSDHSSFWPYGYSAVLAIENFYDDAIARDRNPWYHTTGDQAARVDLDYVVRFARTSLAAVAELAGMIVTPTPTPTPAPTLPPPPPWCQELVRNGSFEGRSDWTLTETINTAQYVTEAAHAGAWSARLGLLPGLGLDQVNGPQKTLAGAEVPAGAAYSTVYQPITLPTGADFVTLRFWYQPGSLDSGGADHQLVSLLQPGTYATVATLMNVLESDGSWKLAVTNLTGFRGQTLVLYFEVYNDDTNGAARTWMHLDDVSVLACSRSNLAGAAYIPVVLR